MIVFYILPYLKATAQFSILIPAHEWKPLINSRLIILLQLAEIFLYYEHIQDANAVGSNCLVICAWFSISLSC